MRSTLVVVLALTALGVSHAQRPFVSVPSGAAPVLDGRLGDWSWGAALSGFVTPGAAAVAEPDTTVSFVHDAEALYVAFRCEEPDPKRPAGHLRRHDDHVWEDDCVQVFIAPENLDKASQARINFGGYQGAYQNWYADIQAYYEFTVNCRGSMSEARNDVRDWDAPWQVKVRREDGSWTAEIRIPFNSLGVTNVPEGTIWGLNLFRIRPPEASGWVNTGHGGYTPLPLGAMRFVGNSAAAQLGHLPPPKLGPNRFTCSLLNPVGQPPVTAEAELSLSVPGSEPIVKPLAAVPGQRSEVSVDYTANGLGGKATYTVTLKGQETPLLAGSIPLPATPGTDLAVRYYSVPSFVEGLVHLGGGERPVRATLSLEPAGGEKSEASADLTGKPGERLRLPVTAKVGETCKATLRVLNAAGEAVSERSVQFTVPARPEWLGTRAGLPLGVLPPWTPIEVQAKTIGMLGKRLGFTDLALPATIMSAGAELLVSPMALTVISGGRPIAWRSRECHITEAAADHVRLSSLWRSDSLALRTECTVEYDGFCWVEVTLSPRGKARLDRLALEIPMRREACRYVYQGHAQACGALSPHGLRRPLSQNLWLGDEERGIAFLAESIEWWQARDRRRQIEVLPGKGQTLWRSTFIDTPTDLHKPYTAQFALHITPAKPVSLRKSRIFHGAYYGMENASWGGTVDIPLAGNLDPAQGTFECWVKPRFDPNEEYDPNRDRSAYNRQLAFIFADESGVGDVLIPHYNADDRSIRIVRRDGAGQYPVIMGNPLRLPADQWSYVAFSWGDKLRLSVNGTVVERPAQGAVTGSTAKGLIRLTLASFSVDDLRISRVQRPIELVPTGPFAQDADTLFLCSFDDPKRPERIAPGPKGMTVSACESQPGRFGQALTSRPEKLFDRLADEGKRIVIFHENWSPYQGYPDLEQAAKLKALADECHQRGMLFLVYFCQLMSDAAPVWKGMENDFMALPERMWYHRDDVKQDCYVSCVNGPYGDLLLDGIAKLADEAGIDGVYMDGTTVPWDCTNPTHPGCGEYQGDGTYLAHQPIRATREFMKRLRSIFASRRKLLFLDAHTGGAINIATQSFCDGYYDGETLARYKPGFRLSPDTFLSGYMGKQFGFRGEFLPSRHTMDQALAISLIHDTATRGQPAEVDLALADYEDEQTQFIGYWQRSGLYTVEPANVLGSLYLKPGRALLVLGSQTEEQVQCKVDLAGVLARLPRSVQARDAVTRAGLGLVGAKVTVAVPGRGWRLIELVP